VAELQNKLFKTILLLFLKRIIFISTSVEIYLISTIARKLVRRIRESAVLQAVPYGKRNWHLFVFFRYPKKLLWISEKEFVIS